MVDRARQPWIVSRKLGFHGKLSGVPGVGIDFHSGDRLSIAWSRSWNYLPTVRPITTARCSFHFLFLLPPPSYLFPRPLSFFFLFSFRFSSFVGPFAGRSRPPTCPFVQLPKTVYDFEDYVRDLEFPRATSPFFPSSLSPFFSLDSTLWIKTPRLLTFSPPSGDHRWTRVELEKYARTYNVSLRSHFVKT